MDASAMDPLPKRRKPRPTSSSLKRFLLSLCLLLLLSVLSFYAWTRGRPFLKRLFKIYDPHSAQKIGGTGALSETEVVRSFFGREESFDLVASVFFLDRGFNDNRDPISTNDSSSSNDTQSTSSWYRPSFNAENREWERLFSQKILSSLDADASRSTAVNLTLPGRVV